MRARRSRLNFSLTSVVLTGSPLRGGWVSGAGDGAGDGLAADVERAGLLAPGVDECEADVRDAEVVQRVTDRAGARDGQPQSVQVLDGAVVDDQVTRCDQVECAKQRVGHGSPSHGCRDGRLRVAAEYAPAGGPPHRVAAAHPRRRAAGGPDDRGGKATGGAAVPV